MERHIHRYERILWGKKQTVVFRCVKPNCKHYLFPEFIIGQKCECYICGSTFVIDKKASRLKKPHCSFCSVGSEVKTEPEIEEEKPDETVQIWDGKFK